MGYTRPSYLDDGGNGYWLYMGSPHAADYEQLQADVAVDPLAPKQYTEYDLAGSSQLMLLFWTGYDPSAFYPGVHQPTIGTDEIDGTTGDPYVQDHSITGANPSLPYQHGWTDGTEVLILSPTIDPEFNESGVQSSFWVPSPPAVDVGGGSYQFYNPTKLWLGSVWEWWRRNPDYNPPDPPDPGYRELGGCHPVDPPWPYNDPKVRARRGPAGIVRRG